MFVSSKNFLERHPLAVDDVVYREVVEPAWGVPQAKHRPEVEVAYKPARKSLQDSKPKDTT